MKISYFVHDFGHPDLARRFEMLRQGGAATTIFGFHRARSADPGVAGAVVDLGQTRDARFAQRVWAVARAIPRLRPWAKTLAQSDVILARNLEMLVLATIARRLYAPHAALVYECLDIHRFMLSRHWLGAALRAVERALLKGCQGLMVSSPAFVREYFAPANRTLPKTFLVENKVFLTEERSNHTVRAAGPPWRIGWFGVLRCRRSLDMLSELLRSAPQTVEVIVAGLPAAGVFPDAAQAFGGIPGLTFLGSFKDEAELARLFRSVHFAWAIDYYEAGGNSNWLLPNRLYRSILYGAVPLALAGVETGQWLADHHAGLLLGERPETQLIDLMQSMTPVTYATAGAAIDRIPTSALVTDTAECRTLVRSLGELGRGLAGRDDRSEGIEAAKPSAAPPRT